MNLNPAVEAEAKTSTHPSSILLNKIGIIIAVILLILAAWAGQTVIVILLGLALSAAGLAKFWSHFCLRGVHCERHLSETRVFPEGTLDLKLKVVNRKPLPLPWLQVTDEVPQGFILEQVLEPGERPGFDLITRSTSIMWYSAVSWQYRLLCRKRGYYPLGPLTVTSGDIFGFYPRTAVQPVEDHIIVYPRIFSINNLAVPSRYPLGESKSDYRLFEDPSRMIGIRDYSSGDSLRRIHWKASARRQQLQVKVFEPSTSLRVGIFLSIDSFQYNGIWDYDGLELGISSAASLSNYLVDKRSQVGLWCNSKLADSGQTARISLRGGVDQLVQILEALAKVTTVPSGAFTKFFENERRDLPLGTTLVFIFQHLPEQLGSVLIDLKESGYQILLFQVGDINQEILPPDMVCYRIQSPGEIILADSSEK